MLSNAVCTDKGEEQDLGMKGRNNEGVLVAVYQLLCSEIQKLDSMLCMLSTTVCADKGEGQDLSMIEGDDDGVLELAPHYQYISGLRSAQFHSSICILLLYRTEQCKSVN